MPSVEFTVPRLAGGNEGTDLENVLLGLSGVEGVGINLDRHVVYVEYDPDFVDAPLIGEVIASSGYPIDH